MKRNIITLFLSCCLPIIASAQEKTILQPEIHGTIRAKYEYQPEIDSGRFEVRNARFSLTGKVTPIVAYKAEVDLSDEGNIRMLDAFTKISPTGSFNFTIGQMRVPFTIDAHRSPHQQYFPNRSFIAKQVGDVRDVGATVGYKFNTAIPIILEGGIFNGSGLTNQKNFWTNNINYSAKTQFILPEGFNLTLSIQKIKPEEITIHMYDAGINYHNNRWHIEAEYLRKEYTKDAFDGVNAFNGFVCYNLPLRKVFQKISFLSRFDYMDNHSNGKYNEKGLLTINDHKRKRLTNGITLSLGKAFIADIRVNYEKYFYNSGVTPKISEQDKLVIEFMTRF